MAEDGLARPEQTFFPDPGLDRVSGVVMALATEVQVLRDRVQALEAPLDPDYPNWRFPRAVIRARKATRAGLEREP